MRLKLIGLASAITFTLLTACVAFMAISSPGQISLQIALGLLGPAATVAWCGAMAAKGIEQNDELAEGIEANRQTLVRVEETLGLLYSAIDHLHGHVNDLTDAKAQQAASDAVDRIAAEIGRQTRNGAARLRRLN